MRVDRPHRPPRTPSPTSSLLRRCRLTPSGGKFAKVKQKLLYVYQTIMVKHLKNDEGSLDISMVCTIIQRVVDDPRIGLDPETNDYSFLYNLAGECHCRGR